MQRSTKQIKKYKKREKMMQDDLGFPPRLVLIITKQILCNLCK